MKHNPPPHPTILSHKKSPNFSQEKIYKKPEYIQTLLKTPDTFYTPSPFKNETRSLAPPLILEKYP